MAEEALVAKIGADLTGFNQGMGRVGRTSREISANITKWAKRAAIAIGGISTAAMVVGTKFEKELMKTATVARAFGKDLDALRNKARELGATTAFSATEAAEGMYDLASAGMNTKEILAATEHSMKLAGATASEMSQATHLLASSLKQFNLDASESKRIVDTYAQAITGSQLTMERLSEAMKFAGTTGAALGWTIEETTAAVAQFANLGLEGSMAGTNLRMSMIFLTKASRGTRDALKEMGLTLEDVNPETHNFGEILKTVGDRAMTTEQAIKIFGTRSGLNMKQLAELARTGATDYDAFVQSLVDAQRGAGRASEMYVRMMDTFWGRMKIFLSALKDLGIEIFYIFESTGGKVLEFLADTVNLIKEWGRTSGVFNEIKEALSAMEEPMKNVGKSLATWLEANKVDLLDKVASGFKSIRDTVGGIWGFLSKHPGMIEYGLIGMLLWGKRGAAIGAVLGMYLEWLKKAQAEASMYEKFNERALVNAKARLRIMEGVRKLQEGNLTLAVKNTDQWEVASKALAKTNYDIGEQEGRIKSLMWTLENLRRIQEEPVKTPTITAKEPTGLFFNEKMLNTQRALMGQGVEAVKKAGKDVVAWELGYYRARDAAQEAFSTETYDREVKATQRRFADLQKEAKEKARIEEKTRDHKQQIEDQIYGLTHSNMERRIREADRELEGNKRRSDDWENAQKLHATRMKEIYRDMEFSKVAYAAQVASSLASTAEMLYSSGWETSKAMWDILKGLRYTETVMNTATAIMRAWADMPAWAAGPMSFVIGAKGAAQLAIISSQHPPTPKKFEFGGIVRGTNDGQGRIIRAGERGDEAIIPLRTGKVPVQISGKSGGAAEPIIYSPHYHFEGSTFMDQNVLRASMANIAVGAVIENYRNDGAMRTMVRRGI